MEKFTVESFELHEIDVCLHVSMIVELNKNACDLTRPPCLLSFLVWVIVTVRNQYYDVPLNNV